MNATELRDALNEMIVAGAGDYEVVTEGCDCYGDAGYVEITELWGHVEPVALIFRGTKEDAEEQMRKDREAREHLKAEDARIRAMGGD